MGLVIRVPEEGQKFLDGQLFGEMIRHVCDVMQAASAAKQSKGLRFPKTTGVATLRPTSDDFKETVRPDQRAVSDRNDRDVGLNLQPDSNRPAKQFIAQRSDDTDLRIAWRRRRDSSLGPCGSVSKRPKWCAP